MKNLTPKLISTLALLLAITVIWAQPDSDKVIIFVGDGATAPTPEDQVCFDSLAQWVDVIYFGSAEFNATTPDILYGEGSTYEAEGIIISESIDSKVVPNFGRRDGYPVPAIIMEGVIGTPDDEVRWPLLEENGGIWGFGTPEDVDVQWKIVDNTNYVTGVFDLGDVVDYADAPDRGVPYIHGVASDHIILATAVRESGGDVTDFVQSEAMALGYIVDPSILYMNVAYTYLAAATPEFYDILHRGVQFVFDAIPVGNGQVKTSEFGLTVYPNPLANEAAIRFSAKAGQEVVVNLYSLIGADLGNIYRGVTVAGDNEILLNTSEYPAGVYVAELSAGHKVSHAKFVIKR